MDRAGDILARYLFIKKYTESGMLVHTFNLSSGEAEACEFKDNLVC